jgi:hypothetical protein
MQALLFADITNRKLTTTLGGAAVTFPAFVQGDSARIGLRFAESVDGSSTEVNKNLVSLRASIGYVDARPTSGNFVLRKGAGTYVEGTNQTVPIAHDASAATVVSALAGIGLSGFSVVKLDGGWIISSSTGSVQELSGASASGLVLELVPSSFVRVRSLVSGGKNHYEVRLIQSPLASTSSFERIVPPAPEISRVQEGGTDASVVWPEIQALKILPTFRGTYQIRRGYKKTAELSVDDGPAEIQTALAALADEDGEFIVTNPATNIAHITFTGSMAGTAQSLLTIAVFSAPLGDPTFTLDLNTAEVAAALRLADEIKPVLELELTVEDENDPSIYHVLTPYRAPITMIRELNWEGLEAASNIDWLRPPHGTSYVPFAADQIITGAQNYVAPIGNGSSTSISLTHNLGTRDLHVTVRKNSSDLAQVFPASVKFDTTNVLTLTFATAPTTNQYVVTISTAGPKSAFQAHTHTLAQITGLGTILDDLGSRVETLEGIVALPAATGSNVAGQNVEILLPAVDISVPPLPNANSRPPLLSAVHDVTVAATSPPFTTVAADSGQVRQLSAAWVIPASRNRREWPVASSGYVASNGDAYYEVRKSGNSYFPTEYEHDLFMLFVSAAMFPAKRNFTLDATPVLQLLGNTRAQYMLQVFFGTLTEDSGSSYAMNLSGITWATPIISERILLSSAIVQHPLNIAVASDATGILTATAAIYGRTQTVVAPTSSAFAIRARLLNFDTENRTAPRGFVSVKMPEATAIISPK